VSGSRAMFQGVKDPKDRADVIAYLVTLNFEPVDE
jgi:cytochrome c2